LLNYKVEKHIAISVFKRDKEIEKSERRARIKLLEEEFLKVIPNTGVSPSLP
jgi:hypothetical protein